MKKSIKLLVVCLSFSLVLLLTSCFSEEPKEYTVKFETNGAEAIAEMKVKEGTALELPEDPEKEGYDFDGWYLEASFQNEVNDGYVVKSDVTLYAKWIEAGELEQIFVASVSVRDDFAIFEENKKEKDNKKTEFMDLEQSYVVGDDNAWQVKPKVSFVKMNVETKEVVDYQPKVSSWSYSIKVEAYDDPTGTYVDGSHLVEKIDKVECTVDFKAEAIGYKVRVTVTPENLSEKQQLESSKYTVAFEAVVVDGYNAYDALDMAYVENRVNDESAAVAWNEFKAEKGLDVNYQPNAVIVHNDIEVTAEDVPSYFFYNEGEVAGASDASRAVGSMKDNRFLYMREMAANSEFAILGNYFTFSAKKLREVVRENDQITEEGAVISHSALFKFMGEASGHVEINNINLVGNAPRVENAIKSGGIILTKVEGPSFSANNNISSAWFITYFSEVTYGEIRMNQCKAYDSYNCFVYNWGCELVFIDNCEFIGAGGPIIIQDHVDPFKEGERIAKTYVTNSKLESYVSGTEGWFKGVGASALVPSIKGLDQLFNPFGKSFLKSSEDGTITYMNLICVNKSGSAESITAEKIKGELKIDDNASFDFGATNPYLAALLEQTFALGAPAFQTSVGGFGFGTTTGIFDVTQSQIIDPSNPIYQGDYMCIYFNGMALTFGYNTFDVANMKYEVYKAQ